ncbi:MAG: hypothetical protein ACI4MJ_05000 [Aristaeellaceae bacterium]
MPIGIRRGDIIYERTGQLQVFASLVTDKMLYPELRFKNACRGAFIQADRYGVRFFSYRAPKLEKIYAFYARLGDKVRALELTQEDVHGYIVSLFSYLSMPMGPMTGGAQAIWDKLHNDDRFGSMLRAMHKAKQTTVEDIKELAGIFDLMAEKGIRVTMHSQQLVEQNSSLFAVTDNSHMFSDGTADETAN